MDIIEVFEKYGVVVYGLVIFFGGINGVKYMPEKWENKYKFLLFSTIFAIIFLIVQVSIAKNFVAADAIKYLVTYTIVTSCYEIVGQKLFIKWGWIQDDPPSKP